MIRPGEKIARRAFGLGTDQAPAKTGSAATRPVHGRLIGDPHCAVLDAGVQAQLQPSYRRRDFPGDAKVSRS